MTAEMDLHRGGSSVPPEKPPELGPSGAVRPRSLHRGDRAPILDAGPDREAASPVIGPDEDQERDRLPTNDGSTGQQVGRAIESGIFVSILMIVLSLLFLQLVVLS